MTQVADYKTDTSDMLIPHGLFRSNLAQAGDIVIAVRRGDSEQLAIVSNYIDNILRFLDAHHEGEDAVVWPVLAERDPTAAALLARMEAQHQAIHELRAKTEALLVRWTASGDPDDGEALAAALQGLAAELEVHFAEEEAEILPLASRFMSAEEWGALPGHAMQHFSGDKLWLILGLVFDQMTQEQLDAVMPHLPPPVVDMWTTTGKAQYDSLMTKVRGAS